MFPVRGLDARLNTSHTFNSVHTETKNRNEGNKVGRSGMYEIGSDRALNSLIEKGVIELLGHDALEVA